MRKARARFVVIGVAGANYYARSSGLLFTTGDHDLFLPPDPANVLRVWSACGACGLELWCADEPLGRPQDDALAKQVVSRRALVRAEGADLHIDLTLVMAGFDFDTVWSRKRRFDIGGVTLPVARLSDIVTSKAAAGRPKDRLFLATHEDVLRQLVGPREHGPSSRRAPSKRRRRLKKPGGIGGSR